MVKIPNLSDLKKMGNSLMDSAKAMNLNEMVDKVKSNIEQAGQNFNKTPDIIPEGEDPLRFQLQMLSNSLSKLKAMQVEQQVALQRAQSQFEAVLKTIADAANDNTPPPASSETP